MNQEIEGKLREILDRNQVAFIAHPITRIAMRDEAIKAIQELVVSTVEDAHGFDDLRTEILKKWS